MKKSKCLLLFFAAIILLAACEKEKSSTDIIEQTNVSKLVMQKSTSGYSPVGNSPFEIHSAGVFQGSLYMSVSFTGGEKVHEFTVKWDGNIIDEAEKKVIDLVIYHSDMNDQGKYLVYDSISADISNLGIPKEELNKPNLWFRVINSTKISNKFLFKAADEYTDPFSIIYNRNVKVTKEGCADYGLWGDLWLVSNDANPVSHYFVNEIDNTISYTPVENDLLLIEFRYSCVTDSSKVCPQLKLLSAIPIKITKLVK